MTARPIMVQGTMSGVGKSLIVAALCRIFRQDGYRVAPFKSQNMALNSAITTEGLEMGRAQVVQAQAAGVEPEVAMNPVLLKPTTDVGSQVVVMGRPRETMAARDYYARKASLKPLIRAAYDDLASRFDIVAIEGAGSPAEVNLKDDDIVNMGVARMAHAPVLLVGDIDRGGVFAQLIGTIDLLDGNERALVRATVVNKFRGDVSILEPGLRVIEERCGVPVAGVVPYTRVDIDDEDSLSSRLSHRDAVSVLDVAVIRLPRIANFTDLVALEAVDGIGVRYVSGTRELGEPDLVIMPGTKNTMADLLWMRECGLEASVKRLASHGTPVIGICGGYQMLGQHVSDPMGLEGMGEMDGMGLLPITTTFSADKTMALSSGVVAVLGGIFSALSGAGVSGYQVHMGVSERRGARAALMLGDGSRRREDGCCQGNVLGTYLHGLFDNKGFTDALVGLLARRKGLEPSALHAIDMDAYRARQYDVLADAVRAALDMPLVYRILEEGV